MLVFLFLWKVITDDMIFPGRFAISGKIYATVFVK